jgi:hypothetical protein
MKKILYLSMILSIIIIPTRLSKSSRGPQRPVYLYMVACCGYYVALRFIIPRIPG